AIISFASFLFFIQSCQRIDTTDLGVGLIPAVDNVNTFEDILDISTNNLLLPDSSIVNRTENHALGVIEDPQFGKTTASIFFDLLPTTSGTHPFVNKDSIKGNIDSVILSLDYAGLYGDSTSVEKIRVFEIAQSANFTDTSYKLGAPEFPVIEAQLAEKMVDFTSLNDPHIIKKGKDTVLIREENILQIRLDKSIGLRLAGYDTLGAYKNDSEFRKSFKGIALKVDSTGPGSRKALAYFNLSSNARTRLTVYYRTVTNGKPDTTFTEFVYKNEVAIGANLVKRNLIGTSYLNNISAPVSNKEKLYIQSSPGSYATLKIPALDTMSNRLIYRAELVVNELFDPSNRVFNPPDYLFIDYLDSSTNKYFTLLRDFSVSNEGYNSDFGMTPKRIQNTSGDPVLQWRFNISRYIQGIVTRKEKNNVLRLYSPFVTTVNYNLSGTGVVMSPLKVNTNIAKGRLILGGGAHPSQSMKLRIIYSHVL
ncbi:MAG: DUF4270 family protein, partial [Chitinophagaceae bacterium]